MNTYMYIFSVYMQCNEYCIINVQDLSEKKRIRCCEMYKKIKQQQKLNE